MTPTQLATAGLPGTLYDPLYPDSDGRPMGESDFHNIAMTLLREGIQDFFVLRSDIYVASNLLFYFEKGNPSGRRDPDVLVAKGVLGKHFRRSYRLWEEGVIPCTLFEIASEETWRVDLKEKRELYARIGVTEYFVFDPEGLFFEPRLQGFRLDNGVSVEMLPDTDGRLLSEQLGLRLTVEGNMIRLIDANTGEPVLTRREQVDREHDRAEREKQRADALAAELERLRVQMQRPNGKN
jgi:Uma2 family endonuclease